MAVANASIEVKLKENSNRGRRDDAPAPYPLAETVTNVMYVIVVVRGGGVTVK